MFMYKVFMYKVGSYGRNTKKLSACLGKYVSQDKGDVSAIIL